MEPFITLWIGDKYLLSFSALLVSVISFYLTGMRKTVMVFKDASGIFQQDKYKPIIESIVNIITSIPLAIKFGVTGVLLGTILSTLLVSFWFEAYVLFTVSFNKSFWPYLLKQLQYFAVIAADAFLCKWVWRMIPGDGLKMFIVRIPIIVFIAALFLLLTSFYSDEFRYFKNLFMNGFRNKFSNKKSHS